MLSWYHRIMLGSDRCISCQQAILDGQDYYTPREATDEQTVEMRRLWGDRGALFAICEPCMAGIEFSDWLEVQLLERRVGTVNWRRDRF